MTNRLTNKHVLITGAASGIGLAMSRQFAEEGASLYLLDVDEAALQTQVAALEELFPSLVVQAIVVNICDRANVEEVLSNLPPIDVLINNAGIGPGSEPFYQSKIENDEATINVNINGTMYITRSLLPDMVEAEAGHIIFVGSIAAVEPYDNHAIYCATKAATRAFSQSLRRELVDKGVKVSIIHPGKVRTNFSLAKHKGDPEKAQQEYDAFTPLEAEDIANTAVFIATQPAHVQIQEVVLTSADQAMARLVKES